MRNKYQNTAKLEASKTQQAIAIKYKVSEVWFFKADISDFVRIFGKKDAQKYCEAESIITGMCWCQEEHNNAECLADLV